MATDVVYNGIKLHNVTTRQWDQQVAYDDSGTDMLATRYRLQFECIIAVPSRGLHAPAWTGLEEVTPMFDPDTGEAIQFVGDNAAEVYRTLRWRLSQPRRNFVVTMDGKQVLMVVASVPTTAPPAYTDSNNGPKPQVLSITHVAGNQVYRILWSVDCEIRECTKGTPSRGEAENPTIVPWSNVLNNRWSLAETMDENAFVTRTIRGKLHLASANLLVGHTYKGLVIPTLESGFKRDRIHYELQPNGLEANYEIVDRQVHTAAPWPASKMHVQYAETATESGIMWRSRCRVKLSGPPNADKGLMIARAFQIIEARLQINNASPAVDPEDPTPSLQKDNSYLCEQATVGEEIGEGNSVEATMAIKRMGDVVKHMNGLVTEKYGKPLELPDLKDNHYNPTESLNPAYYGYTPMGRVRYFQDVLASLHCMLQQPCAPDLAHGIVNRPAPTITADVIEPSRGETKTPDTPEPLSPGEWTNEVADSAKSHIYTIARTKSTYHSNPLRVQLPIMSGGLATDDASLVVSLGRPQCTREITVEAERVGKWPKIPKPEDSYRDGELIGKLLDHQVTPHPPTLDATGEKRIYALTATYRYAMNRPPTFDESVATGVLPFTNHTIADTQFLPSQAYDSKLLTAEPGVEA